MISMLSLLECITGSSTLSSKETKLIAIANWIFHVLYFWRLMFLKDGLILLRYF